MRRFSLVHNSRKSITPQTPTKSIARNSLIGDEIRDVKNKDSIQECAANVYKFLQENNYEGILTETTLKNPSTKDFQNIMKHISAFVDISILYKFEENLIFILKVLKYPHASEITKSQLSSVTPYSWPSLLSMMSWLCDLINEPDQKRDKRETLDSVFFDHVIKEYHNFMTNDDPIVDGDSEFIEKVKEIFVDNNEEVEESKNKIELLENDLKDLKTKFEDISKREEKRKALQEEINSLVQQLNHISSKKERTLVEINNNKAQNEVLEKKISELLEKKGKLKEQISTQEINTENIRDINKIKKERFRLLEKSKQEKDKLMEEYGSVQSITNEIRDQYEKIVHDISVVQNISPENIQMDRNFYEEESISKKEALLNAELSHKSTVNNYSDIKNQDDELEKKYVYYCDKFNNLSKIYKEKKESFDVNHQHSIDEVDKLENDLLQLKLESDSVYIKSKKDYSEGQIQLDSLRNHMVNEKDEIVQNIYELKIFTETKCKVLSEIENELLSLLK